MHKPSVTSKFILDITSQDDLVQDDCITCNNVLRDEIFVLLNNDLQFCLFKAVYYKSARSKKESVMILICVSIMAS